MTDKTSIIALMNATPKAKRSFELPSGAVIPTLGGASVPDYYLHIFRVFECVEKGVIGPVMPVLKLSDEQKKAFLLPDGTVDQAKAQAFADSKVDYDGIMRLNARDGLLVRVALAALCMGYPGDKDVEASILNADEDDRDALLAEAEYRTWGDDPRPFLDRVAETALGLKKGTLSTTSSTNSEPNRKQRRAAAKKAA